MKFLHEDKPTFEEIIVEANNCFGINKAIIKHDYYVWIILKSIAKKDQKIVFKGGTSLSKCYEIINRYSEDIDLNCIQNEKMTNRMYKRYHHAIFDSIEELGFDIVNKENLKSGRKINRIYVSVDEGNEMNMVKVETYLSIKSFPVQKRIVKSYIYKYLKEINRNDLIEKYDLYPFEVTVQSMNRTFIDKIFAICDYYESRVVKRQSRHIYDLYKLFPKIVFNKNFYRLFMEVREQRKIGDAKRCISAQEGYDLIGALKEIVDCGFYKDDYNNVTVNLLYENVKYEDCIEVINQIISKLKIIIE